MSSKIAVDRKARLKQLLQSVPWLWDGYWRVKQELRRLIFLRYFVYDIRRTYAAMFWRPGHVAKQSLSSELLFQYHKLEKGLVMPGKHRLFGVEPANITMNLISRWCDAGYSNLDPVFVGAVETLRAYKLRLRDEQLDLEDRILPKVEIFLNAFSEENYDFSTPQPLKLPTAKTGSPAESFRSLTEARRSVRNFLPEAVPTEILADAIRVAQLSPSACNRQPCNVYIVNSENGKREVLSLQNGNSGFGYLAPHIAVITADEACFFDASERHEPYIDGGLFSMSFILGLRSHGVSSCCLNWCVTPEKDRSAHKLLKLADSKRIIMLVAIGYAPDDVVVPRSPRRASGDVMISV